MVVHMCVSVHVHKYFIYNVHTYIHMCTNYPLCVQVCVCVCENKCVHMLIHTLAHEHKYLFILIGVLESIIELVFFQNAVRTLLSDRAQSAQ